MACILLMAILSLEAIVWMPCSAFRMKKKTAGLPQMNVQQPATNGSGMYSSDLWRPKMYRGKLKIPRPAFLLYDEEQDDIIVSQFGVRSSWFPLPAKSTISRISVEDISGNLASGSLDSFKSNIRPFVNDKILWPNKVTKHGSLFVIPDGFLAPGKGDGNIFVTDAKGTAGGVFNRVTPKKKGAFYHEVEWYDFDGDGHEDMLTARTIMSGLIPKFRGELVWYRNPGLEKMLTEEWEEHIITEGPDVIFKAMPHSDGLAVFCAEFFSERLTVHFVSSVGKVTSSPRVLDSSIGKVFGVDLVDLDGDGNEELLVTNHEAKPDTSGVFAYELPAKDSKGVRDLEDGEFTKHVLMTGFKTKFTIMPGAGSPGFAYAFHPHINTKSTEPKHIVVAGDGSHDVWLLSPRQNERFGYDSTIVADIGGTTGDLLIRDFTGDGIMDVLVPDNDNFNIRAFTFQLNSVSD